jgi:hypothetical protein
MTNVAATKTRFLRDAPPRRLGNVAANLARIQTFAEDPGHSEVVRHLAEESAFFIEWAAPAAEPEVQCELLALQRLLVSWIRSWAGVWESTQRRAAMRETAGQWAQHLLQLAGLVP